MRVIAGLAKGHTLKVPKGLAVRPTSDKVRGAIFNILHADPTVKLEGARVLDLFAGTGALGIEALSRGAAEATFVERDRRALEALRANLDATRFAGKAHVIAHDADTRGILTGRFDLVFADPPYEVVAKSRALRKIAEWLADGGVAVLEHASGETPPPPAGLVASDLRQYGSTSVSFFRRGDAP